MKSSVSYRRTLLGTCLCLVFSAGNTFADDQRVLLSFDNAGHKVQQIVRPLSRAMQVEKLGKSEPRIEVPDVNVLISKLQPGFATLVWMDAEGFQHSTSTAPDPRVSHAPAHITGVDESRVGERDGAWLITGPLVASSVLILLPADPSVGLAFEQWDVPLNTD